MKYRLFILSVIVILIFYPKNNYAQITEKESIESVIQRHFENWKENQIQIGAYLPSENCNWKYVEEHDINSSVVLGMPKDISIYFGDINQDGLKDGMACIYPNQCDGGNGSMNFQIAIFIVSTPEGYSILEKYPSVNLGFGGSFYKIENIVDDKIKAIYFEYQEEDGRCCPSIEKEVLLDFKNGSLYLNDEQLKME